MSNVTGRGHFIRVSNLAPYADPNEVGALFNNVPGYLGCSVQEEHGERVAYVEYNAPEYATNAAQYYQGFAAFGWTLNVEVCSTGGGLAGIKRPPDGSPAQAPLMKSARAVDSGMTPVGQLPVANQTNGAAYPTQPQQLALGPGLLLQPAASGGLPTNSVPVSPAPPLVMPAVPSNLGGLAGQSWLTSALLAGLVQGTVPGGTPALTAPNPGGLSNPAAPPATAVGSDMASVMAAVTTTVLAQLQSQLLPHVVQQVATHITNSQGVVNKPVAQDPPPMAKGVLNNRGLSGVPTGGPPRPPELPLPPDAKDTLYVDNVPEEITKREVSHVFRPFEGFMGVRLLVKDSCRTQGKVRYAFVEFDNPFHARTAKEQLQGYRWDLENDGLGEMKVAYATRNAREGPHRDRDFHQGGHHHGGHRGRGDKKHGDRERRSEKK